MYQLQACYLGFQSNWPEALEAINTAISEDPKVRGDDGATQLIYFFQIRMAIYITRELLAIDFFRNTSWPLTSIIILSILLTRVCVSLLKVSFIKSGLFLDHIKIPEAYYGIAACYMVTKQHVECKKYYALGKQKGINYLVIIVMYLNLINTESELLPFFKRKPSINGQRMAEFIKVLEMAESKTKGTPTDISSHSEEREKVNTSLISK